MLSHCVLIELYCAVHQDVVSYIFTILNLLWRVFTYTALCIDPDCLRQGACLSPSRQGSWVTLKAGNVILGTLQQFVQSHVVNISEVQVIFKAGIKADLWPGCDYWNAKQLAAVCHSTEFQSTSASSSWFRAGVFNSASALVTGQTWEVFRKVLVWHRSKWQPFQQKDFQEESSRGINTSIIYLIHLERRI